MEISESGFGFGLFGSGPGHQRFIPNPDLNMPFMSMGPVRVELGKIQVSELRVLNLDHIQIKKMKKIQTQFYKIKYNPNS